MEYLTKIPECDNEPTRNKLTIVNNYISNIAVVDILKEKKIDSCPHCNSNKFIKFGKYKGIQRFRCTNAICKKTFSLKTNTMFSYSKKTLDLWMKYLILMNNRKSLRECSAILKISLATSFFWRHKILNSHNTNNNNILKNYVEISKIILKENFKGDKSAKYHNKENIFIACGMDSNNTIISKAISKRTISLDAINKNFSKNIDKNAVLSTYNDRYFDIYAKNQNISNIPLSKETILNLIEQVTINKLANESCELANINVKLPNNSIFIHKFSLNIKKWLIRFRGVATKYLENYLNWHIIDFKNSYKTFLLDQVKLFKNYFINSSHIKVHEFTNYKLSFQH